jgi:hypothetical protein
MVIYYLILGVKMNYMMMCIDVLFKDVIDVLFI